MKNLNLFNIPVCDSSICIQSILFGRECMIAAFSLSKIKPQNLHDSETQSAIDLINSIVYM